MTTVSLQETVSKLLDRILVAREKIDQIEQEINKEDSALKNELMTILSCISEKAKILVEQAKGNMKCHKESTDYLCFAKDERLYHTNRLLLEANGRWHYESKDIKTLIFDPKEPTHLKLGSHGINELHDLVMKGLEEIRKWPLGNRSNVEFLFGCLEALQKARAEIMPTLENSIDCLQKQYEQVMNKFPQ